jgi:hypothetical protein
MVLTLPSLPTDGNIAAAVRSSLDATSPVIASQFAALTSPTQQVAYIQRLNIWCATALGQFAISGAGGSTHAAGATKG